MFCPLILSITVFIKILYSSTEEVLFSGAGATLPSLVYKQWMSSYRRNRTLSINIRGDYLSVGSGEGQRRIINATQYQITYAASDNLLSQEVKADNPDLMMFPTVAGSVAVVYNLRLPKYERLTLSLDILAHIFDGNISRWNSSEIARINPNIELPGEAIIPIARLDKSGTTHVFTSALTDANDAWARKYGAFSRGYNEEMEEPYYWKRGVVKLFGYTSTGIAGIVRAKKYSISYINKDGAVINNLEDAFLINSAENRVRASIETIKNAMDSKFSNLDTVKLDIPLVNAPGNYAYPLSTYTYLIVYMSKYPYCDRMVELYRYIEWFLSNPISKEITENSYMVYLSDTVVQYIQKIVLDQLHCGPNRENVKKLVIEQKKKEAELHDMARQLMKYLIPIVCSLIALILLTGVIIFYRNQKDILNNIWRVNMERLIHKAEIKKYFISFHHWTSRVNDDDELVDNEDDSFHWMRIYKGVEVMLTPCCPLHTFSWDTRKKLVTILHLNHLNIQRFFGLTEHRIKFLSINDYCAKGSLFEVLHNSSYSLDDNFKFSMAIDIGSGMEYLTNKGIVHGCLNSICCLIDQKWTVKIADWHLKIIASKKKPPKNSVESASEQKFNNLKESALMSENIWTALEILKLNKTQIDNQFTQCTDVYSFAIIVSEIWTRHYPLHHLHNFGDIYEMKGCFYVPTEAYSKLLSSLKDGCMNFRPPENILDTVAELLINCTHRDPGRRPTFSQINKTLKRINPSKKSVLDCMMAAIDHYVEHLEDIVKERTGELEQSKKEMQRLLYEMLPQSVANSLIQKKVVEPEEYDLITLYFSDIVGFTTISASCTPNQVVTMLNSLYGMFDKLIEMFDVYKVETIGDAYMVISGLPIRNGNKHAAEIANFALAVRDCVQYEYRLPHNKKSVQVRIGIHSGPVVAGVVGTKMPRYCLFGDTVNTTSRMESNSLPMKIQISSDTNALLKKSGHYEIECRGELEIKGKGIMTTYFLIGNI